MKTNFKKGLFTIILACSALIASAAQVEVVYLKNGSIIRGVIIEQIPNASLKIQTADGSIFAYQMDDIEKITKEEVSKNQKGFSFNPNRQRTTRGYRGFIDFGYTTGSGGDFGLERLELSTSHGYQFNPYLFVGIGVGAHFYFDEALEEIPIFLHLRSEFLNNSISPFADFKIGCSVYEGTGFYATPSVGCRFPVRNKYGISLSVGYTAQKLCYRKGHNGIPSNMYSSENFGGFSFKVGFDF